MDITEITQVISNVGFPIGMCLLVFYYMSKQDTRHTEEIEHLRTTLEENTKVLSELTTLIKTCMTKKDNFYLKYQEQIKCKDKSVNSYIQKCWRYLKPCLCIRAYPKQYHM